MNQRDENGNKHGPWEEYWFTGDIKWRGEYTNGAPHGLCIHYYDSGELDTRCNYKSGIMVVLFECYHKDGRAWMKGEFKKSNNRGLWYKENYAE